MAEGLSPKQNEEAAQLFTQAKESADKIIGLDDQINTLKAASDVLNDEAVNTSHELRVKPIQVANNALNEQPGYIPEEDPSYEAVIESEKARAKDTQKAYSTTALLKDRLEARKVPHELERDAVKHRANQHYQQNKDAYQEQALADAKEAGHDDITFRTPAQ